MMWKPRIALLIGILMNCLPNLLAQWGPFHYQRPLSITDMGWQQIVLPDDIYRHLQNDLSDIRIKGINAAGDTLEAPYLIQWPEEMATLRQQPFRIINESRRGNYYFATLTAEELPEIDQISLDFDNNNFDWRVRLEGSQDQREWFTLLDNYRILAFDGPSGKYVFSKLNFRQASYRYYRIRISNATRINLNAAGYSLLQTTALPYHSYPIKTSAVQDEREQRQTTLSCELPVPVPISQLSLEVMDTIDYYRPLRIDLLTDSTRQESGWKYHYTTVYRGTLSSLEKSVFTFRTTRTYRVKVYIENHDNPPLQLRPGSIAGLQPRIIARFAQAADYGLLYGWPHARAPRYDLAKFADKMPDDLPQVRPGPEVILQPEAEIRSPLVVNRAWLWVVMLVVIGLLGWFSIKMLQSSKQ